MEVLTVILRVLVSKAVLIEAFLSSGSVLFVIHNTQHSKVASKTWHRYIL